MCRTIAGCLLFFGMATTSSVAQAQVSAEDIAYDFRVQRTAGIYLIGETIWGGRWISQPIPVAPENRQLGIFYYTLHADAFLPYYVRLVEVAYYDEVNLGPFDRRIDAEQARDDYLNQRDEYGRLKNDGPLWITRHAVFSVKPPTLRRTIRRIDL